MDQVRILTITTFLFVKVFAQGDIEQVTRRNMDICQSNAVCADLWDTIRNREGEGPRRDRRYIQNCICPGTGACPVSEENMISQSRKHKEVLCNQTSIFPQCRPGNTARILHPFSTRNNGKTYIEIRCLCPLHFRRMGKRTKATIQTRTQYDAEDFTYMQMYECNWRGEFGDEDMDLWD